MVVKDEIDDISDTIKKVTNMYKLSNDMKSDFERKFQDKINDRLSEQLVNKMFPPVESNIDNFVNKMLNSKMGVNLGNQLPGIGLKLFEKTMNSLSDEQIDKCMDMIVSLFNDEPETESEFVKPENDDKEDNENEVI